jgi:hypothetical protein
MSLGTWGVHMVCCCEMEQYSSWDITVSTSGSGLAGGVGLGAGGGGVVVAGWLLLKRLMICWSIAGVKNC